jgi:hypothetical protein
VYRKLLGNIEECHRKQQPWSATLLQIRKVYGIVPEISLVQVGVHLSEATNSIVYFCHDLPDSDSLKVNFSHEDIRFPSTDELTLYAVPPELLWIGDGEHYRKAMAHKIIEGTKFRCVYVCYRSSEAVQKSWPYTRFVELHVQQQVDTFGSP